MFRDALLGVKITWKIKKAFIIRVRIMVSNAVSSGLQLKRGHKGIFWDAADLFFGDVYTGDHSVTNHWSVFFVDTCVHTWVLYFILRLLKCLLDHVVPYWKPSNNLPLSVSYSHLKIACFPPAHSTLGKQSSLLLLKETKNFYPHRSLHLNFLLFQQDTFVGLSHNRFLVFQLKINCSFLRDAFLDHSF